MRIKTREDRRQRIKLRLRKRIAGSDQRPRLTVFRSLSHIYVQVIDDIDRRTIASASDKEPDLKGQVDGKKKTDVATLIGTLVAERAKEKGVTEVVFDRGGFPFHGRVKALAEAARASGLKF